MKLSFFLGPHLSFFAVALQSGMDLLVCLCLNRVEAPPLPPEIVHLVITFVTYRPVQDNQIRRFADQWCSGTFSTEDRRCYGPISEWDTSEITNMSFVFSHEAEFNDDLSLWDVSRATTMEGMFSGARAFNQSLAKWNVSRVTNMSFMFSYTRAFNQPLDSWDMSQVTNKSYMFEEAFAFNQSLEAWGDLGPISLFSRITKWFVF